MCLIHANCSSFYSFCTQGEIEGRQVGCPYNVIPVQTCQSDCTEIVKKLKQKFRGLMSRDGWYDLTDDEVYEAREMLDNKRIVNG